MFDTHCHLNFKRFSKEGTLHYREVWKRAIEKGVTQILIPGTDLQSSQRAVEIAEELEGVYAGVGIHPHHTYKNQSSNSKDEKNIYTEIQQDLGELERLISNKKIVAIGEVGLDYHPYQDTKYQPYVIDEGFKKTQSDVLGLQISLSIQYRKTLIIHNRDAKEDMLARMRTLKKKEPSHRIVFHCCEPDREILQFAINNGIYIGVDGDVTYGGEKAEFVKHIPLSLLVLETDSPFLLPEPYRSNKKYPNEPQYLLDIATHIAFLRKEAVETVAQTSTENAMRLFDIS